MAGIFPANNWMSKRLCDNKWNYPLVWLSRCSVDTTERTKNTGDWGWEKRTRCKDLQVYIPSFPLALWLWLIPWWVIRTCMECSTTFLFPGLCSLCPSIKFWLFWLIDSFAFQIYQLRLRPWWWRQRRMFPSAFSATLFHSSKSFSPSVFVIPSAPCVVITMGAFAPFLTHFYCPWDIRKDCMEVDHCW